jgi:hypothetical protein
MVEEINERQGDMYQPHKLFTFLNAMTGISSVAERQLRLEVRRNDSLFTETGTMMIHYNSVLNVFDASIRVSSQSQTSLFI